MCKPIYLCQQPAPSPFTHTYFIHHLDSLHKQTVLTFFQEFFSQIGCDVELITAISQESEDFTLSAHGFLHATPEPPHRLSSLSLPHRVIALVSLQPSDGYLSVLKISLQCRTTFIFTSFKQSTIMLTGIFPPYAICPCLFTLHLFILNNHHHHHQHPPLFSFLLLFLLIFLFPLLPLLITIIMISVHVLGVCVYE